MWRACSSGRGSSDSSISNSSGSSFWRRRCRAAARSLAHAPSGTRAQGMEHGGNRFRQRHAGRAVPLLRFVFTNREIRAGHDAPSVVYSSVCLCVSLYVYSACLQLARELLRDARRLKLFLSEEVDVSLFGDDPYLLGAGLSVELSLLFHLIPATRPAHHLGANFRRDG
jgi:hypothetical protein